MDAFRVEVWRLGTDGKPTEFKFICGCGWTGLCGPGEVERFLETHRCEKSNQSDDMVEGWVYAGRPVPADGLPHLVCPRCQKPYSPGHLYGALCAYCHLWGHTEGGPEDDDYSEEELRKIWSVKEPVKAAPASPCDGCADDPCQWSPGSVAAGQCLRPTGPDKEEPRPERPAWPPKSKNAIAVSECWMDAAKAWHDYAMGLEAELKKADERNERIGQRLEEARGELNVAAVDGAQDAYVLRLKVERLERERDALKSQVMDMAAKLARVRERPAPAQAPPRPEWPPEEWEDDCGHRVADAWHEWAEHVEAELAGSKERERLLGEQVSVFASELAKERRKHPDRIPCPICGADSCSLDGISRQCSNEHIFERPSPAPQYGNSRIHPGERIKPAPAQGRPGWIHGQTAEEWDAEHPRFSTRYLADKVKDLEAKMGAFDNAFRNWLVKEELHPRVERLETRHEELCNNVWPYVHKLDVRIDQMKSGLDTLALWQKDMDPLWERPAPAQQPHEHKWLRNYWSDALENCECGAWRKRPAPKQGQPDPPNDLRQVAALEALLAPWADRPKQGQPDQQATRFEFEGGRHPPAPAQGQPECPDCYAADYDTTHEGFLRCGKCGKVFGAPAPRCPKCGRPSLWSLSGEKIFCAVCGGSPAPASGQQADCEQTCCPSWGVCIDGGQRRNRPKQAQPREGAK